MTSKTVVITRTSTGDQGTFGNLVASIDGIEICRFRTGELPYRDVNHDGVSDSMLSCINPFLGKVVFTKSDKFPRGSYELQDVENGARTGVRIHVGNWCGDSKMGYAWDVEGCILLGTVQESRNNQTWMDKHAPGKAGFMQAGVFNSTAAVAEFQRILVNEPFVLQIVEDFNS